MLPASLRIFGLPWQCLRLCVAAGLLWVFLADNPARLARLRYAALPDLDHAAEARRLRDAGRLDEAIVVIEAGLAQASAETEEYEAETVDTEPGSPADGAREGYSRNLTDRLERERQALIAERDSAWRRAREFGVGALVGTGDSLESVAGAVAADLFVIGDMRDLLIQGTRLALDRDTDEVIVALSAVGIVTTIQPGLDWVPSFLKCARKAGCLTAEMGETLVRLSRQAAKGAGSSDLRRMFHEIGAIVRSSSPGAAARLLRHVRDPAELTAVARFVNRQPRAALALQLSGREGVRRLVEQGATAERGLLLAARKGDRGMAWLRTGGNRLLRPHPLTGLAKGLYKRNVQNGLTAFATRYLDARGAWIVPALSAWLVLEAGLLLRRLLRGEPGGPKARSSGLIPTAS